MASRKPVPAKIPAAPVKAKALVSAKPKAVKVAKPAAKPLAEPAAAAPKTKAKLVRDSFTIPKAEYAVLGELKQRATTLQRHAKKGELLRAGIALLSTLSDKAFLAALDAVPSLKTGRPAKEEPVAEAKPAKAVKAAKPVKASPAAARKVAARKA